ncbi:sigma-70 family RNA polymerase sigma factor [Brucella sp. 21LCYQ03]|nr:sigma-70 family RNA polymerase sigma factor [Brucella sp. 21LCYQ03]
MDQLNGFSEKELLEHIQALRNFARRFYSSPSDIDDLVQETLTKALGNVEKFQHGTQLRSWLFTIMRNTFCTKFGMSKREHVSFAGDAALQVSVPAVQDWKVRGYELERALARLSEDHRQAITFVFVDCMSYEEAASRCGCALGTMKSRINRARSQLWTALNSE